MGLSVSFSKQAPAVGVITFLWGTLNTLFIHSFTESCKVKDL